MKPTVLKKTPLHFNILVFGIESSGCWVGWGLVVWGYLGVGFFFVWSGFF